MFLLKTQGYAAFLFAVPLRKTHMTYSFYLQPFRLCRPLHAVKILPVGVYANLNTRLSESRNDSFLCCKWKAVIRFHYILQSFRLIVILPRLSASSPLTDIYFTAFQWSLL